MRHHPGDVFYDREGIFCHRPPTIVLLSAEQRDLESQWIWKTARFGWAGGWSGACESFMSDDELDRLEQVGRVPSWHLEVRDEQARIAST